MTGFRGIRNDAGRPKGAVNKATAQARELIQNVVGNELENITDLLDKLDPKERIDAIIKLMNFVIPKQSEIAVEAKMNQIDLSLMTTAELIERAKAIE